MTATGKISFKLLEDAVAQFEVIAATVRNKKHLQKQMDLASAKLKNDVESYKKFILDNRIPLDLGDLDKFVEGKLDSYP